MERSEIPLYATVIGIVVTVLSFLIYVFFPSMFFIVTFVIGIVMMVGGYLLINKAGKDAIMELEYVKASRAANGSIICLDGPYVPYEECGPIESLENL